MAERRARGTACAARRRPRDGGDQRRLLLEPDAVEAVASRARPLAVSSRPICRRPRACSTARGDDRGRGRPGRALLRLGCKAVVVKGGHWQRAEAVDIFSTGAACRPLALARIATPTPMAPAARSPPQSRRFWRAARHCAAPCRPPSVRSRCPGFRAAVAGRSRVRTGRSHPSIAGHAVGPRGEQNRVLFGCCRDASMGTETAVSHLRVRRASARKLNNAMRLHRFPAPGGASGARLGAPPDLAEEPVRYSGPVSLCNQPDGLHHPR